MRLKALLLSLGLIAGQLVHAQYVSRTQVLPPTPEQFRSLLAGYLDTLRTQAGIPGMAAAIVEDKDVLWSQAFGNRDVAALDATRTDTPFHLDGLTELFTASMVLRCIDRGQITLDDRVGGFTPSFYDPNATVRQVLTHTSGTPGNLTFSYYLPRLDALKFVVETCSGMTFHQAFRALTEQLGMLTDTVPGPDAASTDLSNADIAPPSTRDRYQSILQRLAVPYSVSAPGAAAVSRYSVTMLGAASGLISSVLDFAKFDIALRNGLIVSDAMLQAAWTNPVNTNGTVLPHGMGWFVQTYNGEPVVWQFGVQSNAASSLVITLPNRKVTFVLLANSDGLAKPDSLSAGDVTVSPFAKVFLGLVVK